MKGKTSLFSLLLPSAELEGQHAVRGVRGEEGGRRSKEIIFHNKNSVLGFCVA